MGHTVAEDFHIRERKKSAPTPIKLIHLHLLSLASMGLAGDPFQHSHRPAQHGFEEALVGLVHPIRRQAGGRVKEGMALPKRLYNIENNRF